MCSWLWSPILCYNILWRYFSASETPPSEELCTWVQLNSLFHTLLLLRDMLILNLVLSPFVGHVLWVFPGSRIYQGQTCFYYHSHIPLNKRVNNPSPHPNPKSSCPPVWTFLTQCLKHKRPQSLKWIPFGCVLFVCLPHAQLMGF